MGIAILQWSGYAAWAAEGKRKLAALEQRLNRYKTHQSRIDQMLETPQAMDALARDSKQLGGLDEELMSYDLDRLFPAAYPLHGEKAPSRSNGMATEESQTGARLAL